MITRPNSLVKKIILSLSMKVVSTNMNVSLSYVTIVDAKWMSIIKEHVFSVSEINLSIVFSLPMKTNGNTIDSSIAK